MKNLIFKIVFLIALFLIISSSISADVTRISNRNSTFNGTSYFAGNVGIGTASPERLLTLNKYVGNNEGLLKINLSASTSNEWIVGTEIFNDNPGAGKLVALSQFGKSWTNKNAAYIVFRYNASGSDENRLILGFNGREDIINAKVNGQVGIGLPNPTTDLTILSSYYGLGIKSDSSTNDVDTLFLSNNGVDFTIGRNIRTKAGSWDIPNNLTNSSAIHFPGSPGTIGDINFITRTGNSSDPNSGVIRMVIKNNGDIGINTSNPKGTLDITGHTPRIIFSPTEADLSDEGGIWFPEWNTHGIPNTGTRYGVYLGMDGIKNFFKISAQSDTSEAGYIGINRDSGNVGIGTINPASRLDINGTDSVRLNIRSWSSINEANIRIDNDLGNPLDINNFGSNAPGNRMTAIPAANLAEIYTQSTNALAIYTHYAKPIIFGTGLTERMRIDGSGNVGIGTTTKLYTGTRELDVSAGTSGDVNIDLVLQGTRTGNTAAARIVGLNQNNSNAIGTILFNKANSQNNSGSITLNTMNNGVDYERVKIDYNGNVGIGTTNPAGILQVSRSNSNLAGTVDIVNNTPTVTGTSTTFTTDLNVGDQITINGTSRTISSIASDTSLSTSVNWAETVTGKTYNTTASDRMIILKNGKVGIGTSNPQALLQVGSVGTSTSSLKAKIEESIGVYSGNKSIYLYNDGNILRLDAYNFTGSGSALPVQIGGNGGNVIIAPTNGSVGINTTSPSQALTVVGTISATNFIYSNGSSVGGSSQWISNGNNIYYNNGNVGIGTSGPSQKFVVIGDANITGNITGGLRLTGATPYYQTITGTGAGEFGIQIYDGAPTLSSQFTYNSSSGETRIGDMRAGAGTDYLSFYANGERIRIINNGNVGIGTSNPSQKLDVNGSISMNGNLNITSANSCIKFASGGEICDSP